MMKKVTYLLTVLFALALMSMGCEKENPNPDDENTDVVLRILKMADNIGMENPISFQYNSDGLINKIDWGNYYNSIEYDEQNRPIKWSEIEYDRPESVKTKNIEWTDAGFIITDYNWQDIYILDADGRIIKRSTTTDGVLSDNYKEYTYVEESKVIIEWKSTSEGILGTSEIDFGGVHNPFKDFNVALIVCSAFSVFPEVEYGHGKYAFSSYDSQTWTANYEVNEQNFPIRGTFKASFSNSYEYWYYEYETD